MSDHCIYALLDPSDESIRYIGYTGRGLHRRLNDYRLMGINPKPGRQSPVKQWCVKLADKNLVPDIALVEVCDIDTWCDREKFWIKDMRQRGENLLNVADGGVDGYDGRGLITWQRANSEVLAEHMRSVVAKNKAAGWFDSDEWKAYASRAGFLGNQSKNRRRGIVFATCSCGKQSNIGYINRHHVKRFNHEIAATWQPWPFIEPGTTLALVLEHVNN